MGKPLALLFAFILLNSCSLSPKPLAVTVRWDTKGSVRRAEPNKSDEMNCYFINVSGPGMPQNYGPEDLGKRDPFCMGLTSVFGPFDLDTLKAGAKIKVVPGSPRTVTILGAVSAALADECPIHPLPEYFNTANPPQLYPLGETTTGIFVDSSISVRDSYSLATVEDLARKCSTGETTGTTLANSPIKSVRALAVGTSGNVKSFALDPDTFVFSDAQTYSLPFLPNSIPPAISDDFSRYQVSVPGASAAGVVYALNPLRIPAYLGEFIAGASENWFETRFSPNADNFYATSNAGLVTFRHRNSVTTRQSLFPIASPFGLAVTPNYVYTVGGPSVRTNLFLYGLKRVTGPLDSLESIPGFSSPSVIASNGAVVLVDRTFRFLFLVTPPTIRSFQILSGGHLQQISSEMTGTGFHFARLTRDGKFIIALENTINPYLRLFNVSEAGVVTAAGGAVILTTTGGGVQGISLDPRQRFLVTKNINGKLTPIEIRPTEAIQFVPRTDLSFVTNGIDPASTSHLDFVPIFEQN